MSTLRPALCASCRKLIGTAERCPYCGTPRREWQQRAARFLRTSTFDLGPICTWVLIFFYVAQWLGSLLFGRQDVGSAFSYLWGPPEPVVLDLLGANRPTVLTGMWWTAFTANFLHFGFFHIFMNAYSLRALIPLVTDTLGESWTVTLFIAGGAMGFVLSGAFGQMALGASAGSFALIGAGMTYAFVRGKGAQDPAFRTLLFWTLLTFVLGIFFRLDNWAHLGGLGAGFLFTVLWMTSGRWLQRGAGAHALAAASIVAAITAFACSLTLRPVLRAEGMIRQIQCLQDDVRTAECLKKISWLSAEEDEIRERAILAVETGDAPSKLLALEDSVRAFRDLERRFFSGLGSAGR